MKIAIEILVIFNKIYLIIIKNFRILINNLIKKMDKILIH